MLGVLENFSQGGATAHHMTPGIQDQEGQPPVVSTLVMGVQIAFKVILMTTDHHCYKRFQNMKP
ncbi:hypothetical protein H5410_003752, partial [Solanum commersonii]